MNKGMKASQAGVDERRRVRKGEHEGHRAAGGRGLRQIVCGVRVEALDMLSFTCSRKHLNLGDSLLQRLHTFRGRLAEGDVLAVVRARAWGAIVHQRQSRFNIQLKLQENMIHRKTLN